MRISDWSSDVCSSDLASNKALDKAGLTIADIACVIPHQANLRIIEAIADRLKIPLDRFYVNLDRFGNTSAAAVAMALDEANRTGRLKQGDYIKTGRAWCRGSGCHFV